MHGNRTHPGRYQRPTSDLKSEGPTSEPRTSASRIQKNLTPEKPCLSTFFYGSYLEISGNDRDFFEPIWGWFYEATGQSQVSDFFGVGSKVGEVEDEGGR